MDKIKPITTRSYRERIPVENTKGKQPTGRNVGKLRGVMKLPLDVFFEIASHLHPLDVLQLSRVSNELRSMLLSRQSRHIWIAARKNIEPPFPDIEMAISEPKLAHLLFEQVCSACGSGRAQFADYAVAVRFCAICSKNNIKKGTTLAEELDIPKGRFLELVNLLPSAHGPRAIMLNRPTALFHCVVERNEPHAFSWAGLLEHWQQEHGQHKSFVVSSDEVCSSAASMKRLLEALRLPDTTRLSEIHAIKPTAKHYYRVYR